MFDHMSPALARRLGLLMVSCLVVSQLSFLPTSLFADTADAQVGSPTALSIEDSSQVEGDGPGSTIDTFRVSRSSASGVDCNITATISFGSGDSASAADFVTLSSQNFIVGGSATSRLINAANVVGDTAVEPDETYTVTIVGAVFGSFPACEVGDGVAVGTIVNDDAPSNPLSIEDSSQVEGDGPGSTIDTFRVSRSSASGVDCNITATISFGSGDSASAADFVTLSSQNFIVGGSATSRLINAANVVGDTAVEPDETYTVTIVGAVFGSFPACEIGDGVAVGTIVNDDGPVPTPTPTATPVEPTPTPTATPVEPTPTTTVPPVEPTATPTATATPVEPTPTATVPPVEPTATPTATATPVEPTPTATVPPVEPTATPTATATPVEPTPTATVPTVEPKATPGGFPSIDEIGPPVGDPGAFGPTCLRLDLLPGYPSTLTLQYEFDLVIMGDGTSNAIYRDPAQGDTLTTASGRSLIYVIKCGFGGFGTQHAGDPDSKGPEYDTKHEHEIDVVAAILQVPEQVAPPAPLAEESTPEETSTEPTVPTPSSAEPQPPAGGTTPTDDGSVIVEFRVDGCPAPGSATVRLDGRSIGEISIPEVGEAWASIEIASGVDPELLSVECRGQEVVVPLDGDPASVGGRTPGSGDPSAGDGVGSTVTAAEVVAIEGPPRVAVAAAAAVEGVADVVLPAGSEIEVDLASVLVDGLTVIGLVNTSVGPAGTIVESGASIAVTTIASVLGAEGGSTAAGGAPVAPIFVGCAIAAAVMFVLERRFAIERR